MMERKRGKNVEKERIGKKNRQRKERKGRRKKSSMKTEREKN